MSGKFIYCVLTLILLTVARFGHGETDPSTNIPVYCLGEHQFYCLRSEQCVPISFKCDGSNQCPLGEDEDNCEACNAQNAEEQDKFFCTSNNDCISAMWRCDGARDCPGGEDEVDCENRECSAGFKACDNGQCIDESWWCDDQVDCANGADEQNCKLECNADTEFMCPGNATTGLKARCVPARWKCDGEADCDGGEDEHDCGDFHCEEGDFQCTSEHNKCIPMRWSCDGEADCKGGEDEHGDICQEPATTRSPINLCTSLEFACASGATQCVLKAWRCDGTDDCTDGSDEHGCGNDKIVCGEGQFLCEADQTCIPTLLTCNGRNECSDGADEKLPRCESKKRFCDIKDNEFSCEREPGKMYGSQCVNANVVCDGSPDCDNGKDEDPQFCDANAPERLCSDDLCSGGANCTDVYGNNEKSFGHYCLCAPGYKYVEHVHQCQDINECLGVGSAEPVCDQICHNVLGSYKCECEIGYSLQPDKVSCKAVGDTHPRLLFTNRHQIRSLHITNKHEYFPLVDSKAAVAIDFDYAEKLVFYTDMTERKIFKFTLADSDSEEDPEPVDLNIPRVETPDGLAYNWIYKHLYWTDTASNTINMAVIDQTTSGEPPLHTVIYNNSNPNCTMAANAQESGNCIDEPRALVLHPQKGLMFWSDWGSHPNIIAASLDGSSMERIVYNSDGKTLLVWPNGLTLDLMSSGSEKLYWIDAKLHSVFSCSIINCMGDAVLLAYDEDNIKHPFSITVFENHLYWTDWHNQQIVSASKFTGRDVTHVLGHLEQPMDLKVYHSVMQPVGVDVCSELSDADRCQHICIQKAWQQHTANSAYLPLNGMKHTCLCSAGYVLNSDGRTCTLVLSAGSGTASGAVQQSGSLSNNERQTGDSAAGATVPSGLSVGTVAAIASSAVLLIGLVISLVLFMALRRLRKNRSKNMNFENPIYKRTTEDKLELPSNEYQPSQTTPSAMIPLTSDDASAASLDDYRV